MLQAQSDTQRPLTPPQPWDLLGPDSVRTICTASGPFVTLFIPARHPGAPDLSRAERMKTILKAVERELEGRRFQGPIAQMLKPLENLAADARLHAGGSASVAFVSPGIFRHHRLLGSIDSQLVVASHPHIAPLLANLIPAREFYILAITKKHVRLGRWYDGDCEEVALPANVPKRITHPPAQPDK
jgi:hypothetical protein